MKPSFIDLAATANRYIIELELMPEHFLFAIIFNKAGYDELYVSVAKSILLSKIQN